MIAAVARDTTVLEGGVSSRDMMPPGRVGVAPLAWLTPLGEWKPIQCDEDHAQACRQFDKDYLKKSHTYTVVSGNAWGGVVQVRKMSLDDECFGYGGPGNYFGPAMHYAAVAAEYGSFFVTGDKVRRVENPEADLVRRAFAAAAGSKLDSTKYLTVYSLRMDSHRLFAVQRAFQDYASLPSYNMKENLQAVFALGQIENGHFQVLSWPNEAENDENEQILGLIHLKTGRSFLVNAVSDEESQYFNIYGVKAGKVALIYSGGGGGC